MDGKQLRNSILQWAIQGKLVPQDPNDEPASVLLERIREEKARLVKEKKIKRDKNESIIYRGEDNSYYEKILATGKVKCIDDEIPFEIPSNWQWERWGNISLSIQYGYNAPAEINGTIRMVRISDIQNGEVLWNSVPFCYINDDEIPTYELKKNDILFARTGGTVGKSFLVNDTPYRAIYAGYLIRTRYSQELVPKYLKFFMESQLYWEQLKNGTIATAQPNCNGKTLSKMFLPIPPKSEQTRIVKMLGELKPFLDKFEDSEFHLRELNTKIQTQLKQSILQQAIQGLLVNQDPDDELASVLLERIKVEKERLIKEKKIKRDKQESIIYRGDDNKYYEQKGKENVCIDDEIPFRVPESWSWARLGSIADIYTGNSISESEKQSKYTNVNGRYYIGTKDVGFDGQIYYDNGVSIPHNYEKDFRIAVANSVLMCIEGGSAGRKIAILNQDVHFGNKLCCFTPYAEISKFLYYYLQSPIFIDMFNGSKTGIIGGVSIKKIMNLLIPIPPFSEMQRIWKRIDSIIQILN